MSPSGGEVVPAIGRLLGAFSEPEGVGTAVCILSWSARTREDLVTKEAACGRRTISMTCTRDGKSHEITDGAVAAGRAERLGQYNAICGHQVLPAPLASPDGDPCEDCIAAAVHKNPMPPRPRVRGRRGRHAAS